MRTRKFVKGDQVKVISTRKRWYENKNGFKLEKGLYNEEVNVGDIFTVTRSEVDILGYEWLNLAGLNRDHPAAKFERWIYRYEKKETRTPLRPIEIRQLLSEAWAENTEFVWEVYDLCERIVDLEAKAGEERRHKFKLGDRVKINSLKTGEGCHGNWLLADRNRWFYPYVGKELTVRLVFFGRMGQELITFNEISLAHPAENFELVTPKNPEDDAA
jgi:hypothetical protein